MAYNETPKKGTVMLETKADRFFGFLGRHKVAITAITSAAVTLTAIKVITRGCKLDAIEFIKENGLYETYLSSIEE